MPFICALPSNREKVALQHMSGEPYITRNGKYESIGPCPEIDYWVAALKSMHWWDIRPSALERQAIDKAIETWEGLKAAKRAAATISKKIPAL